MKPQPVQPTQSAPFTPLKIKACVKIVSQNKRQASPFTLLKIKACVKPQFSLFNFESWMSLSEVHLALNEQTHHCVSSQKFNNDLSII